MALIASESSTYTPVDSGTYSAVCTALVDLGTQETHYGTKKQVWIQWELDEERDDGKRYTISRRYTLSLTKKAALREDLDSWRGRAFTKEELNGFDLHAILGAPCMITITHNEREGNVYANVAAVAKLPKGMTAITPSIDLLSFDMDNKDMDVFEKLPEWMQELLKSSADWDKPTELKVVDEAPFDDDVGF